MADMELTKPEVTDEMVEYVKAKYGDTWLENTNSKGKEVDASNAQPVSTLVHKSPKPSKMISNVVLGLVAAKVSSSNKKKHWYVPPPKDLKCPPMNIKSPIKKFTCYF
ncbi:hypothetical protein CTI12_AA123650 [Artemisia annua]|uniref:Uncharacterized protein n=1 Tax=Artemisia annua TaxID=35608 RepID=A0A2U1PQ63_ARTAN|nr:hypothetical protein CTI12_AA123650 [Artemisia annua]